MKTTVGKHLPEKVPAAVSSFAKQLPDKLPPAVSEIARKLPEKLPPAVKAASPKRDWFSTPLRKTGALGAGAALVLGGVVVGTAQAVEPIEAQRTSVASELDELLHGKSDPGTGTAAGAEPDGGNHGAGGAEAGSADASGEGDKAEEGADGGDTPADGEAAKDGASKEAEPEAAAEQEPGGEAPAEEPAPAAEEPAAEEPAPEPAPEPEPEPAPEEPAPSVPLDDMWVTNEYGWRSNVNPLMPAGAAEFHNGIDFGANTGTPVKSFDSGTVTYAEYHQYGGLRVIIDHGNGLQSTYSHLNEILVEVGQEVDFNQAIGTVGTTGNSTGPHLHFEMLRDGEYIDPAPLLGL